LGPVGAAKPTRQRWGIDPLDDVDRVLESVMGKRG
jgi:hypothetical protein